MEMAATGACVNIASGYFPLIHRSTVSTSLTVKRDPVTITTRRYAAPTERASFTTTHEYRPSDMEGNEKHVKGKMGEQSWEAESNDNKSERESSGPFMEDVKVINGRWRLNHFFELAKELVRSEGGGPRWFSPLECCSRLDDSPLLLFLPGIDGTGAGLVLQYPKLAKIFDIWCLHIPVRDRTTFTGLVKFVEKTVKSESSRAPNRPIYVVGESLGACLALAVAARNPNLDLALILANPALSFDRSPIHPLLPLLGFMPEQFPLSHPYLLSLMTGEPSRMLKSSSENGFSPQQTVGDLPRDILMMSSYFSVLNDILPKETLIWKLEMLKSASMYANSRIHAVKAETLVLISGKDQLLTNQEEIVRCQQALPRCDIRKFDDSGPFLFLEDGFDMVMTIKGCSFYRRRKSYDYVLDFLPPTYSEYKTLYERNKLLVDATSPVMFSTLENGEIVKGLAGVPSEGPVLMVGYHMLLGLELVPIISKFLDERNILVRGIAHPMMFFKYEEAMMPDMSFYDTFRVMGAVPVSGTNFFRLLSSKSHVLLYPGGVREALHRKGEQYKLFWPEQSEFVRMAARFGAKIVPFGAVGEDDFGEVVVDYDDLMKISYFRNQIRELTNEKAKLRATATGEVANQDVHLPWILPKIPGRFYFRFGKPIETAGRDRELKDREKAHELYLEVKSEVENCIAYLKKKREDDPYRSIVARLAYQARHGSTSEIPTFEP